MLHTKHLLTHRILTLCAAAAHGIHVSSPVSSAQENRRSGEDPMTAQEQDVPTVSEVDLAHAVRSDACVLFTGDEDTAETLARRLHDLSGWRQGPFVPVDCRMPAGSLESHLFNLLTIEG